VDAEVEKQIQQRLEDERAQLEEQRAQFEEQIQEQRARFEQDLATRHEIYLQDILLREARWEEELSNKGRKNHWTDPEEQGCLKLYETFYGKWRHKPKEMAEKIAAAFSRSDLFTKNADEIYSKLNQSLRRDTCKFGNKMKLINERIEDRATAYSVAAMAAE